MVEVSIIMATYNRSHFIPEALRSIQNQTYKNWECIIIDDGSSDNTKEVVREFLKEDQRFKYHKRSFSHKKGLPGCRNQGIELAKGDYIIFFDDDDVAHPQLLEIALTPFDKGLDFCIYKKQPFKNSPDEIYFSFEKFELGKNVGINQIESIIRNKIAMASCTVLWKSHCFDNIRFNENLMYAEEWECYTRIILEGVEGYSINNVLYFNRKHAESNTGEFRNKGVVRLESKAIATKLIIDNLEVKGILSQSLIHHFIRLSFQIKNYDLLTFILKKSSYSILKKEFYKFIFILYPFFRPIFVLKGKYIKVVRSKF